MGIQLKKINKNFGKNQVLFDIDLTIQEGEFVSLIGKSGSGKSTLLYVMSSLDNPTSGEVMIDEASLARLSDRQLHQFRNTKMGFVFQFHYLIPELTALENVLLPAQKTDSAPHIEHAHFLLNEFELNTKKDRMAGDLSGGEQQRVAIARALVMKPRYLFADEPTGNLDTQNGDIVMTILKRFNQEYGTTILLVTHDSDFAKMANRAVYLVDGRIA